MKSIFIVSLAVFTVLSCHPDEKKVLTPDHPGFAYTGRFDMSDPARPVFMYSGCAIKTVFTGTSVELILKDEKLQNYFTVIVDDSLFVLATNRPDSTYMLAKGLQKGSHNLEIIRRTEWHGGNSTFLGLRIDGNGRLEQPPVNERKMEFIGDSYTCGYGNEGLSRTEDFKYETENNYLSFGAITARAVNADYVAICRSGIGMVHGYGGGRGFNMPRYYDEVTNDSTIAWDYSLYQPHVVFIALIGNDLSAPLDSTEFIRTYLRFLQRVRNNYPLAKLVCAAGPCSPGKDFEITSSYIHAVVDEFKKTDQNTFYFEFNPFTPSGSDWHPNLAEHKKMAEELIPFIRNLMNW